MVGKVSSTVNARVGPVAGWEVSPERFGGPGRVPGFGAVLGGRRAGLGSRRAPVLRRIAGRHFDSWLNSRLMLDRLLLRRVCELLQRPVVGWGWLGRLGSFGEAVGVSVPGNVEKEAAGDEVTRHGPFKSRREICSSASHPTKSSHVTFCDARHINTRLYVLL